MDDAVGSGKSGFGVRYESKHEDGRGRLISVDKTRRFGFLRRYDAWRVAYCEKHRTMNLPVSFREGKVNPFTLAFSVVLRIQEVRNGSGTKSN